MSDQAEETRRAVREVAERLGVDPADVVIIVDEVPDILQAARQAPVTWADLAPSYYRASRR